MRLPAVAIAILLVSATCGVLAEDGAVALLADIQYNKSAKAKCTALEQLAKLGNATPAALDEIAEAILDNTDPDVVLAAREAYKTLTHKSADELSALLDQRWTQNEKDSAEACYRIYLAEEKFRLVSGRGEYAHRLKGADGLLAQQTNDMTPAIATAEGSGADSIPYHGYRFKILAAQGANAPGGARQYVVDGHMKDGFAVIAWPVAVGRSGNRTFFIDTQGQVCGRALGEKTTEIAATIPFNPENALAWEGYPTAPKGNPPPPRPLMAARPADELPRPPPPRPRPMTAPSPKTGISGHGIWAGPDSFDDE